MLFQGDVVMLIGKEGKKTIVVALQDLEEGFDYSKIRMNKVIMKNLKLGIGDSVCIKTDIEANYLSKIHILPFSDTVEGLAEDLTQNYLVPYFKDAYRPLYRGDSFIVKGIFRAIEFKVVATEPNDFGIVSPDTVIFTEGEPIQRSAEDYDFGSELESWTDLGSVAVSK